MTAIARIAESLGFTFDSVDGEKLGAIITALRNHVVLGGSADEVRGAIAAFMARVNARGEEISDGEAHALIAFVIREAYRQSNEERRLLR